MTAMPIAAPANRIRVSANPDRAAPPFDALQAASWSPGRVARAGAAPAWASLAGEGAAGAHQGTLQLVVDRSRSRRPARPTAQCAPGTPGTSAAARDDAMFGPVHTPTADLPDPQRWAGQIAMSVAQVCVGARPAPQVARHLSPAIYESVLRRHSRAVRRGTGTRRPMRVRRVLVDHTRDGVVEAAVVLDDGGRIRPIALRLDGEDGRWIVTALEML